MRSIQLADASAEDFGGLRKMRVAIVHDDLVQWGGAEKVLLGLSEIYPDAPIYTSVYDSGNKQLTEKLGSKKIITSFLQKIPGWKILYKMLLPLYPMVFEQFDFSRYDLVISHTTRFAKCIITKPQTKHICYCHTPPRFLWNFSGENQYNWIKPLMDYLRKFDKVSSNRVDYFLAGSKNAANRIREVYGKDSKVVYPFIDLKRFHKVETFDGGYFVVISRINKYKRVDLAIEACRKLKIRLKVIGSGSEEEILKQVQDDDDAGRSNIEFLGNLSDEMVVKELAGAKALIIPGIEDFGLTSIEAQALGKPVIAFGEGGALETIVKGKTGIFFEDQNIESLERALKTFDPNDLKKEDCIKNAGKFSKEFFIRDFKQIVASL